jgi:hypothetical protein
MSRHQAKVLTAALLFVKEFRESPEGNTIRNVPEGITSELVKTECLMIQKKSYSSSWNRTISLSKVRHAIEFSNYVLVRQWGLGLGC